MAGGSIDGLVSGLDTTTIISQLMSLERQPQNRLKTLKTSIGNEIAVYQALNSRFSTLASKAQELARAAGWRAMKATSSSASVTATASSAASSGQLSFAVQHLSRAGAIASTGTVASTAVLVASGSVVVARGADRLGLSNLGAGAGLTTGSHTLTVTQATTGASAVGTGALAATTNLAAPATLEVTVDGTPQTVTIAAGSYSQAQLADAVTAGSGGSLTATIDGGVLTVSTTHEGSAASLQVTGGSALADLRLAAGGPTTGTDGLITVDGGPVVTVTSAGPGVTTALTGPKGTITAASASGLRTGTATVANVDPGGGNLASLVDAINAAGAGLSAAAVKVGASGYRLQIASTTTGADSNISVDTTNLSGGVAAFATVQSGRDALIRIGEGAGAYDVMSATDTINDLLSGVTVQLHSADPAATVTVTVAQDGNALADKVAALVEAANGALAAIKSNSTYDPETRKAGLLLADGNARRLTDQVYSAISSVVGDNSLASAGAVGISLVKDGTVAFDRNKFLAAYAADPAAVTDLFLESGTATDSRVSYLAASDKTQAGTYAVALTTPAAQATATGTALSGAGLVAAETIEVRVGGAAGTTATYAASAGESLASVANGLNAAFAQQALALSASVVDGQLVLRSSRYGSSTQFEVRSSLVGTVGEQSGLVAASGVWEEHTGVDVAGTINGIVATGNGQILMAPATDETLGGLALTITATVAGALGSFTYIPGVAARLDAAASEAVAFGSGSITTAITGRQQRITELDSRISDWDVRLAARERTMRRQFAAMEKALGNLRNQSNWLAGQLASLPTNSPSSQ